MPRVAVSPLDCVLHTQRTLLLAAVLLWPLMANAVYGDDTAAPPHSDWAARRQHWAFQPVRSLAVPDVRDRKWPASAVDRFILAKLDAAGLVPAPPADKRTLIRRATFDLIGLPPTRDEIAAFLGDESPDAFANVVDRLLDSPHFGERWARHWLDLVRYAETRGHEFDHLIPNAFQYRDYVIRALNAGVPYDQFVTEHIAGDLVDEPRLNPAEQFNESILGTGFFFLGEEVHSPVDIRQDETDRLDNKIDVMTKSFLGLTVSCARCHDHKFDPITAKDYYALSGFLLSSSYRQVLFDSVEHNRRVAWKLATLRAEHAQNILKVVADSHRSTLERLADYLLAAREANRASRNEQPGAADDSTVDAAAKRGIDAALVAKWQEHLRAARDDHDDPLHAWAVVAASADADAPGATRKLIEPIVQRAARAANERDPDGVTQVVLDFSQPRDDDWRPDGVAFGLGPVRVGDALLGSNPSQPIREIARFAAARLDPIMHVAQLAPGAERDPGKAAALLDGRTLRTPTITLAGGKLYYLVHGSGVAYAAVDSHRLIAGPLHGSLVKNWTADDKHNQPRWIEHDLSAYTGHRVHVVFSAPESTANDGDHVAEFAILKVVEADRPPVPTGTAGGRLVTTLGRSAAESFESLARAYERLMRQTNEQLASGQIASLPDAADVAWLANWLIGHAQLVRDGTEATSREIAAAAKPFLDRQAAIAAEIMRKSRAAPAVLDGSGVDELVLLRGNPKTPGELAPRRFLELFDDRSQLKPDAQARLPSDALAHRGSGRLELARRITDPANPLVARVFVNRVWHHLFGRGIVASVDNFGLLGEPPTHPELLDHLASRFIEDGWSVKRLIHKIMLSHTYQMSSRVDERAVQVDPQNTLLHHAPVRRLEGEVIRDAILAVSGRLDRTMFGPSIEVHLTPFMEGRGRPAQSGPLDGDGRRSIYLRVRRNFSNPMLTAFDAPTPFTTIGRRSVSNVPAQALVLLNSPFVADEARRWALRELAVRDRGPVEQVTAIYETAFARLPSPDEIRDALAFLDEHRDRYATTPDDPRPWQDLCHVLLNVKEFIFSN